MGREDALQAARTRARRGILRRAGVAWGAAFLLALGSAAITYSLASEYDATMQRFAEESEMQSLLAEVLQRMVEAESAQRGYAITGDRAFLAPYLENDAALPETLDELGDLLGTRGEDEQARELERAIAARQEFTRETVALVRSGHTDQARARIATGEGRRRMDRVR
ncbi:MAG: CHASE3 domain-containing protein, partial [Myxococcota bacterium]|nr:CHASE3 domain-containing protein [Myxococcota bacterium]